MTKLINSLRLETAQFNNFIIENYLAWIKNKNYNEPQRYLFNSFFGLSESLAALGSAFENIAHIKGLEVIPLKEAIAEAAGVVYLIETATDIVELTLKIKGINTENIINSIQNISSYGKEFNKSQSDIDTEIEGIKQDNEDYFNNSGSYKFSVYNATFSDTIAYLSSNASVLQVRNAFKKINDIYEYYSPITGANYTHDKDFLSSLLNTLTILLLAFGYIEPFFQKSHDIVEYFEEHIKDIIATQAEIFSQL